MARKSGGEDWITEDALLKIKGWARDGYTDKQIAQKFIGINEATLCRWKNSYPQITQALKEGHAPVDVEVEDALCKAARGYYVTVKKPIKVRVEKEKKGEGKIVEEHIEYADEEIYIPPRDVAMIFWLKNRRPDKWRDKPKEVEATQENDGLIDALYASEENWDDE